MVGKWKKQHNVKRIKIAGDSGDVRGETVDSWQEMTSEFVQGMPKKTSGTWTKQRAFGRLCLIMALQRRGHNANVERRQSRA